MRTASMCLAVSMLLASSVASAQVNPPAFSLSDLPSTATEIPGQIVVEGNDLSASDLRALKEQYGLHSASSLSDDDEIELADVAVSDEDAVIARLSHDKRIKAVSRNEIYRASGFVPNDPEYPKQWGLKRIGMETAWNYTAGMNIVVSVIDTGIAPIKDLEQTTILPGWNTVDDNDNTTDFHSHGTHVSGTTSGSSNEGFGCAGIAYKSKLLPVKVLGNDGSGSTSGISSGIIWATKHGANVINMSLGGGGRDQVLEAACKFARDNGVVVVCAAGNSGRTPVEYPAAYEGNVAVSATDSADHIASFSSRGKVSLGSPGVGIVQSTINRNGGDGESPQSFNGSSMASPMSAGSVALLESLGLRGESAKQALLSNTDAKDDPTLFGAGILNAAKAVKNVYWHQFLIRVVALFGLAWFVKRRISKVGGIPVRPGTLGMLVAGTGIAPFLPLTGLLPKLGSLRFLGEMAIRPLGEMDVLVSSNIHQWLPLASALPAVAFLLLGYGVKSLRSQIGGFSIGAAALLTQLLIQNDGDWGIVFRLVMVANLCLVSWIARVVLDSKIDEPTAQQPG